MTGTEQERTFTVDLSKCEYTEGKVEREFDSFTIFVYTPEMIVIEKLRAICQQMEAYEHRGHRNARARDFYDIYIAVTSYGINLCAKENIEVLGHVFAAKQVPLALLTHIAEEREFHRLDWPAVIASTEGSLEPFDFYFDFVLAQVEGLKALWVEQPPL